ncbi:MAG: thiamine phosphate synthase [Sphingobacterium sp.]
MILVISPEHQVPRETQIVNAMFDRGLDVFHIRKKHLDAQAIQEYVHQIDPIHRHKLVLHHFQQLAIPEGLHRFHCSAARRDTLKSSDWKDSVLSTSVHSIEEFNALSDSWNYSFLSPVYPSISKAGYGADNQVLNEFTRRKKGTTKLIALGGVTQEKLQELFELGADGAALLGAVWSADQPVEYVATCVRTLCRIKSHTDEKNS